MSASGRIFLAALLLVAGDASAVVLFSESWTETAAISTDDVWAGVPGVVGYRGDDLVTTTGVDPRTILADGATTPIDVIANQVNPNTLTSGGIAEFEIANPVVALQGSGTADAPHLVFALSTTGFTGISVSYVLYDLDGSSDDALVPVTLQLRVGGAGSYENVTDAYRDDVTEGPSLAGLATPIGVTLPEIADDAPLVELRVLIANAAGNDEWVGVDDFVVSGVPEPIGAGAGSAALLALALCRVVACRGQRAG